MKIGNLIETNIDKFDSNKFIKYYENIIVAQGGDGTLLRAIKLYRDKNLPFFGINTGTIGFLMNEKCPIEEEIPITLNTKMKKFSLIKAVVSYRKTSSESPTSENIDVIQEEFQSFNDIMIGGDMNSWIQFNVKEKDDFIGKFNAGGIIISTPQGSTGINKNNGGVILPLSSSLWSITGDKASRKIEFVIKPRKIEIEVKSRTSVSVWVDGSNNIIQNVEKVSIEKGDSVKVIFVDFREFKKKRRL